MCHNMRLYLMLCMTYIYIYIYTFGTILLAGQAGLVL